MTFKKLSLILTSFIIAASAVGCELTEISEEHTSTASNAPTATDLSGDDSAVSSDGNSGSADNNSDLENDTIAVSNHSYSVYIEHIDENVSYAQISEMRDTSVQTKINEYLQSLEAERYESMRAYEQTYDARPILYYADNSVLSMMQLATFNGGGSSKTFLNLNMETGEEMELTDIASMEELAQKIYSNDGIGSVSGYDGAKIEDYIAERHISSVEDAKENLERCSFHFDENGNIILHLATESGVMEVLIEE